MTKTIWFDMDGTLADLYAVDGWLEMLMAEDFKPYAEAKVMLNMSHLARLLHKVQRKGYRIGIISWTSKNGSELYNAGVSIIKTRWLTEHLPSVDWDEIKIVNYGTNKFEACGGGILFDDEQGNRDAWEHGFAFEPSEIIDVLKELAE